MLRPVIDNLEQLIDMNEEERYRNEKELQDKIEEIFSRGLIQAEAMNFIRGRSIVRTYLIIDEAQNMTPGQVKGIITRAGKGTKIILLGDPAQIDRPFLDERTNGLCYASEHMKGSPLCWQITMKAEECERSDLATGRHPEIIEKAGSYGHSGDYLRRRYTGKRIPGERLPGEKEQKDRESAESDL